MQNAMLRILATSQPTHPTLFVSLNNLNRQAKVKEDRSMHEDEDTDEEGEKKTKKKKKGKEKSKKYWFDPVLRGKSAYKKLQEEHSAKIMTTLHIIKCAKLQGEKVQYLLCFFSLS